MTDHHAITVKEPDRQNQICRYPSNTGRAGAAAPPHLNDHRTRRPPAPQDPPRPPRKHRTRSPLREIRAIRVKAPGNRHTATL